MKNNFQKDEISNRINVLYSDLKTFQDNFIWGAIVFGSCRSKNIPDEFKPKDKDLPNNMECRLRISFGTNQHKFRFSKWTGQETYNWLIKNTGLENYTNMLGDIWPVGGYSWLVEKPEHIELLNKKADSICELSEPLLKIREYRGVTDKVRAIVQCNGGRWTDRSSADWSYLEEIEEIVEELKSSLSQKPAETKQAKRRSIIGRIVEVIIALALLAVCSYVFGVVTGIFIFAALLTIFHLLGWLERIKRLFTR